MSEAEQRERTAIAAVRQAAGVCRAVQRRLVTAETLAKKDKSPVTVADFASQAVVARWLQQELPDDLLVAEEDAAELRAPGNEALLAAVGREVSTGLGHEVSAAEVLGWIDRGGVIPAPGAPPSPRCYWTLDPIDGTKGFLRNEQYAVALAYLEDGEVTLGVLGCPNLPNQGEQGLLVVARRGGGTRVLPLGGGDDGAPAHVAAGDDPSTVRFCESVESGHSDQELSAEVARVLGITQPPLRLDSQAKYALLAQGEAAIYLRLPTQVGYQEKIWDHAAGSLVVREAGGRVTDVDGAPLDFRQGRTLANNRGVVATNGALHDAVLAALAGRV